MRRCPSCGLECGAGANFCSRCGANLRVGVSDDAISRMIGDYQRALRDSPHSPDLHFQLGLAYKQADLDDLAVQSFQRVCELEPTFADAHWELGAAHHRLGQAQQAICELRRALELDPAHTPARRLLERLQPSA